MATHVGPAAFPPLEAFLIEPRFVASDLWVWPLLFVILLFGMRGYHKAAGLAGRDVDLVIALKALNGFFLWSIVIGLSRAVHRATDDVIVSGVWTGVALTLTTGGLQLLFKYSPIAPTFRRVQEAVAQYRLKVRQDGKARKAARARGEALPGETPVHLQRDTPADVRRQVSVLMRKDLFADPPTPAEPAPEPEKPPVA